MTNRKKRLKKAIESLEKRRKEHLQKIEEERNKEKNKNYALVDYWEREIKIFELEKEKKQKLLKKAWFREVWQR